MIALQVSKGLLQTDTDMIVLGVYISSADSPYYKDTDIYNGISMLEDCILDIMIWSFIVFGDINARTGNKNLSKDEEIDELCHSNDSRDKNL